MTIPIPQTSSPHNRGTTRAVGLPPLRRLLRQAAALARLLPERRSLTFERWFRAMGAAAFGTHMFDPDLAAVAISEAIKSDQEELSRGR